MTIVKVIGAPGYENFTGNLIMDVTSVDGRPLSVVAFPWEGRTETAIVPARCVTPFIGPRIDQMTYRARGYFGRKSDLHELHVRKINGKLFDFVRITWADGPVSVRVFEFDTTNMLHEWES